MTNPLLEHPNEEALERFLLHRAEDQELEVVETHILACESCVTRLENLELQLTDLKTALTKSEEERIQKGLQRDPQPFWKGWLTVSSLSWVGAACVALAMGLTFVPHSHRVSPNDAQAARADLSTCDTSTATSLATCRGTETSVLPAHRALNLRLDATDLAQGPIGVQLVNSAGGEVWQGKTVVKNDSAQVSLPQIARAGPYFLRFYNPSDGPEHGLLREFRFEVK